MIFSASAAAAGSNERAVQIVHDPPRSRWPTRGRPPWRCDPAPRPPRRRSCPARSRPDLRRTPAPDSATGLRTLHRVAHIVKLLGKIAVDQGCGKHQIVNQTAAAPAAQWSFSVTKVFAIIKSSSKISHSSNAPSARLPKFRSRHAKASHSSRPAHTVRSMRTPGQTAANLAHPRASQSPHKASALPEQNQFPPSSHRPLHAHSRPNRRQPRASSRLSIAA